MGNLSHSMNGDKYKSVLDKYNIEDDKYSFIIMSGNGDKDCTCYSGIDEYEVHCKYEVNVAIIDNIKDQLMDDNTESETNGKDGDTFYYG